MTANPRKIAAGIITKRFEEDSMHAAFVAVYDLNAIGRWIIRRGDKLWREKPARI
jgi:hypothetical protein